MKSRVAFLLLSALTLAATPIKAQDTMPITAPDFHKQTEVDDTAGSTTTVRLSPPESAPSRALVGAVSSLGSGNTPLSGALSTIIQTPPVLKGAESQNVPPEMFRVWLQKGHPDLPMLMVHVTQSDLLEVKGQWDDASKTLRALGIPYHRIRAGDLRDVPFDNVKVLVVNCSGIVPKESLQRIRDFVSRGGFLLSTDWALDNLVQKAFPGYVEYDGKENHKAIYDASAVNPDPALFANTVTNAHWKMDKESHMLRVLKPGTVRVLAISHTLQREDPGSEGVLAVVFPFGRGQVMHLVAHFDNNAILPFGNSVPDPAPIIGISLRQAIAANFIVQGLTHSLPGSRSPR